MSLDRLRARVLAFRSRAIQGMALSPCGACVVGALPLRGRRRALIWREDGRHALLAAPSPDEPSRGLAVSRGGQVVVGVCGSRACLWESDGILTLAEADSARATGVSADGTAVVGWTRRGAVIRGFLWRRDSGLRTLEPLPGRDHSNAAAVTPDGGAVVGFSSHRGEKTTEAVLWTGEEGRPLGFLDGQVGSRALAASQKASVIVGFCVGSGFAAFRRAAAMTALPPLRPGEPSLALAVSDDGRRVAGWSGRRAVLWEERGAPRDLQGWIREDAGLELRIARGLSADGTCILADARDARGRPVSVLLRPA